MNGSTEGARAPLTIPEPEDVVVRAGVREPGIGGSWSSSVSIFSDVDAVWQSDGEGISGGRSANVNVG